MLFKQLWFSTTRLGGQVVRTDIGMKYA